MYKGLPFVCEHPVSIRGLVVKAGAYYVLTLCSVIRFPPHSFFKKFTKKQISVIMILDWETENTSRFSWTSWKIHCLVPDFHIFLDCTSRKTWGIFNSVFHLYRTARQFQLCQDRSSISSEWGDTKIKSGKIRKAQIVLRKFAF